MAAGDMVERALDILTLLADHPYGLPVSDVSRRLDLPKSAVHRLLSILVGKFLGVWQEDVKYEIDGDTRRFTIPKIIEGEIVPIAGKAPGQNVVIENSQYWIGPRIVVAQAVKSKLRMQGRNWDFKGLSAEIVKLDWQGP